MQTTRTTMHIIIGSALLVDMLSINEIFGQFFGVSLFQSIGLFAAVCGTLSALYRAIVFSSITQEIRTIMRIIIYKLQCCVRNRSVRQTFVT
jgi:hypothetical protein